MVIIPRGPTFLKNGAIVPTERELEVITHALIEEHDRVIRGGGDHYGPMDHLELKAFIAELQKYKTERGT